MDCICGSKRLYENRMLSLIILVEQRAHSITKITSGFKHSQDVNN